MSVRNKMKRHGVLIHMSRCIWLHAPRNLDCVSSPAPTGHAVIRAEHGCGLYSRERASSYRCSFCWFSKGQYSFRARNIVIKSRWKHSPSSMVTCWLFYTKPREKYWLYRYHCLRHTWRDFNRISWNVKRACIQATCLRKLSAR